MFAGDKVLKVIADNLKKNFRQSDFCGPGMGAMNLLCWWMDSILRIFRPVLIDLKPA